MAKKLYVYDDVSGVCELASLLGYPDVEAMVAGGITVTVVTDPDGSKTYQIEVNIDGDINNITTVGPGGILTLETPFQVTPGDGITASVSGTADHILDVEADIDGNVNNITTSGPGGILTLETPFAGVNGNGITVTAGGTAGHAPTVTARVDAAPGNDSTMVAGATGGVRTEVGVGARAGVPSQPTESLNINAVALYTGTASGLASVTNNHLTRNMLVQGVQNKNISGNFKAGMVYDFELQMDQDGGGFLTFSSSIHVNPVDLPAGGVPPGSEQIQDSDNTLAPGVTFTRRSRITLNVTTLPDNTGTWEESINTIRLIGWALKGF